MKLFPCILLLTLSALTTPVRSVDLTPEQLESLRARLHAIKETLTTQIKTRNLSAAQIFSQAAANPAQAVDLYLNCVKSVEYTQKGRPESDFRAWKDNQADRLRSPGFQEGLIFQLRYLAMSCQAAETEDKSQIFSTLVAYVDALSHLTDAPSGELTQSVANSVFAREYHLESLLGRNNQWEAVPINIAGIYGKTILPYLRANNPASLMGAWDKRIEQQTRLVMMLESKKTDELRGLNRDQSRRVRGEQTNQRGVIGEHSKEEFERTTLPLLQWGKMKDKFSYIDALGGASEMLQFVEANLQTELGEQLFSEFDTLISESGKKSGQPDQAAQAAPATGGQN